MSLRKVRRCRARSRLATLSDKIDRILASKVLTTNEQLEELERVYLQLDYCTGLIIQGPEDEVCCDELPHA